MGYKLSILHYGLYRLMVELLILLNEKLVLIDEPLHFFNKYFLDGKAYSNGYTLY